MEETMFAVEKVFYDEEKDQIWFDLFGSENDLEKLKNLFLQPLGKTISLWDGQKNQLSLTGEVREMPRFGGGTRKIFRVQGWVDAHSYSTDLFFLATNIQLDWRCC